MNDIQKAQRARILSCYGETPESLLQKSQENDLEKGGEGSRGGKIIGHTKSGKPVYDTFEHPAHKDFSYQDHTDAENIHDKMLTSKKDKNTSITDSSDEAKHHFRQRNFHASAAGELESQEKKKKRKSRKDSEGYDPSEGESFRGAYR